MPPSVAPDRRAFNRIRYDVWAIAVAAAVVALQERGFISMTETAAELNKISIHRMDGLSWTGAFLTKVCSRASKLHGLPPRDRSVVARTLHQRWVVRTTAALTALLEQGIATQFALTQALNDRRFHQYRGTPWTRQSLGGFLTRWHAGYYDGFVARISCVPKPR